MLHWSVASSIHNSSRFSVGSQRHTKHYPSDRLTAVKTLAARRAHWRYSRGMSQSPTSLIMLMVRSIVRRAWATRRGMRARLALPLPLAQSLSHATVPKPTKNIFASTHHRSPLFDLYSEDIASITHPGYFCFVLSSVASGTMSRFASILRTSRALTPSRESRIAGSRIRNQEPGWSDAPPTWNNSEGEGWTRSSHRPWGRRGSLQRSSGPQRRRHNNSSRHLSWRRSGLVLSWAERISGLRTTAWE
jgi:hypothetical protein